MTEILAQPEPFSQEDTNLTIPPEATTTKFDDPLPSLTAQSNPYGIQPLSPLRPEAIPSKSELKQERHIHTQPGKFKRALGATAMCFTILASSVIQAESFDQNELSNIVWGNDKATVETYWHTSKQPPADRSTDVYIIPGTGTRNAIERIIVPLAPTFMAIPDLDRLMTLKEGAHPAFKDTFAAIDQTIDTNNPPDRIIFYGMSVGGKEAIAIAAHVRTVLPQTDIAIILSSSPYNQESSYQLRNHSSIPFAADMIEKIDFYGGPLARFVVEVARKHDQCQDKQGHLDVNKCLELIKLVADKKFTDKIASNELFSWQVALTRSYSIDGDIEQLRTDEGAPVTDILYLANTHDIIVDEKQAIQHYQELAKQNGISFSVEVIKGNHASEDQHPKRYMDTLNRYFSSLHNRLDSLNHSTEGKTQLQAGDNSYIDPQPAKNPEHKTAQRAGG